MGFFVLDDARLLGLLSVLPIHVADMSIPADLLSLGRRHDLSAYDADYLRLAIHGGVPIATRDKKLAKAVSAGGHPENPELHILRDTNHMMTKQGETPTIRRSCHPPDALEYG